MAYTLKQFLSTLSLRRATLRGQPPAPEPPNFYPRSPCGERQQTAYFFWTDGRISIHALLAESDATKSDQGASNQAFLSTLSLRRATWLRCWQLAARDISIHALLAESDGAHYDNYNLHCVISIHALLAESDVGRSQGRWKPDGFLSTLSLRRATNIS